MNFLNNQQLWWQKLENNCFAVGFTQMMLDEMENLSYIILSTNQAEADEEFIEVEAQKATFAFSLPFASEVIEDATMEYLAKPSADKKFMIVKTKEFSN